MRGLIFFIIVPTLYILSLPWLLVVYLVKKVNHKLGVKLAYNFSRFIGLTILFISGAKFDVEGEEHLKQEGGVIYISNHKSMFDILLMTKYIKEPIIFISKKEISKWPIVAWWMMLGDTLFMDRSNIRESAKAIKKGISYLEDGKKMALFPEGTRGKEDVIQEFKSGSFKLATRSNAMIIPLAIKGTNEVFENNKLNLKPETIHFRIGEPVIYSELDDENKKNISNYVRDIIVEMYESV